MTSASRRTLALSLVLSTAVLSAAAPAAEVDRALFHGRVLQSDGLTPRDGVVIALVDTESQEIFRSQRTGDEGAFRIDSAPAGPYAVVAETGEGAFLASDQVDLRSGDNQPLALILRPGESVAQLAPGAAGKSGSGVKDKVWWQWVLAGAIGIIALWAIDDARQSTESMGSDF